MVKVTFNSALAQKEAKKDEPKSSEEALIAPPDAVAVDCKVLARVVGGVPAAGMGGSVVGVTLFRKGSKARTLEGLSAAYHTLSSGPFTKWRQGSASVLCEG